MNKKILLISPTMRANERTPKGIRIPEIALSMIAAYTPENFDVEIIQEEIEEIDFNKDCDLVGISCLTSNAPRAYEVGQEFKKRGKTVVYGGIHPTVMPDEALKYGDSVIIGEAEGAWDKLLDDYLKGKLKPKYENLQPDLSGYPNPKRSKIKGKSVFNVMPIATTRGCPYNCNFCCVPHFFGTKLRHLPVEKVVEDIIDSGGKHFLFLDDNIIGHPKYAKELFRAIAPLRIKWVGQASLSFVKDEELMNLARASGCIGLFFGVETVSKGQLEKMKKSIKEISGTEDAIKKVRNVGIYFHASVVFGFDEDRTSVFDETLEFLLRNKIGGLSLHILTPCPGTEIYKQFKKEGRLLTENWLYYDHGTVVYQPKNMTPMELAEGYIRVKQEFSKYSSIGKRLLGNLDHISLYTALNLAFRHKTKMEAATIHDRMATILSSSADN